MIDLNIVTLLKYALLAGATQILLTVLWKIYLHPLVDFPGPKVAAATDWYKTYHEAICQKSWFTVLEELHAKYGSIVRVGPSELHFIDPKAYDDIYNNSNRWDKDPALTAVLERKDVLNPLFSYRAICNLQDLIQRKVDRLCDILKTTNAEGKSSDLYFGFRCFTVDTVTSFCFAKSINALDAPNFKAPIVEAMEASNPAFIIFKHFSLIRKAVFNMPPWLSVRISPQTSGLINLQQLLIHQVNEVVQNPKSLEDAPHKVIYHQLLDRKAYKSGKIPDRVSLSEEAQTLVFAGTDTTGNTLMTAVIKECLRITPGVTTPLSRIVPPAGAIIDGTFVPGGTSVGVSSVFVHTSEEVFKDALKFDPDRWLQPDSAVLERWLVPFSKGPRACMGQNFAWCELYLMFTALFRRFDMELDGISLADLKWRDTFLPHFQGRPLRVFCQPVAN